MRKNLLTIAAGSVIMLPVLLVASEGSHLVQFAALAYGVALAAVATRTEFGKRWVSRFGDAIDSVFPDTAISE